MFRRLGFRSLEDRDQNNKIRHFERNPDLSGCSREISFIHNIIIPMNSHEFLARGVPRNDKINKTGANNEQNNNIDNTPRH
jgi:hypothetical protein